MSLSGQQKRQLRGLAHALKPCVTVGSAGVTEALLTELQSQLEHHELIKVRCRGGDRDGRSDTLQLIASRSDAELVTQIGNVGVLYRPRADRTGIKLSR